MFLVVSPQARNAICYSVGGSVHLSDRQSVCRSVRQTLGFIFILELFQGKKDGWTDRHVTFGDRPCLRIIAISSQQIEVQCQ